MNALTELQAWYASNCDGEWEHYYGVEIGTLDNPGWALRINLVGTNLEDHVFSERIVETSDDNWYLCRVVANQFEGTCDPSKLELLLKIFLDWAKSQNADWLKPPPPMTDEELREQEDRQFYESLNDDVPSELCRQMGCAKNRIRNSVMCRDHHFEMIRKYPFIKRCITISQPNKQTFPNE